MSCHNEVLKDLIEKSEELEKTHTRIEQLCEQNKELHEENTEIKKQLAKIQETLNQLTLQQKGVL